MKRTLVLMMISLIAGGVVVQASTSDQQAATLFAQILQSRAIMREQVEQCQHPVLPPTINIPRNARGTVLIDAWGDRLILAKWLGTSWAIRGINPDCPTQYVPVPITAPH